MKHIVLSSVVTALLLFTGCSQNEPAVDTMSNTEPATQVEEVKTVETEVVASDESVVDSSLNTNVSLSISEIEGKLPSVYFDFDKFEVDASMQAKISEAAALGKNAAQAYSVKLEGNCDEWGSDEYNFALGLKRADSVKKALVAEGIESSRISMVSYGESNPTCNDKIQACWAKNRRVDFKILP